jgi:hypothetical protein
MKTLRLTSVALALLLALPAFSAAAASRDALALVPADATTVGFIRMADLRSNPFQLRVFEEMDKASADGDAARFLEEAGLNLREDVDAVVACTTSADGQRGQTVVFFEGRFHADRLSAAAIKRGATRQTSGGGEYYRLKEHAAGDPHGDRGPGAVAFVGANLVVAGNEAAVIAALSDRAAGGSHFAGGQGLGKELHRVDPAATAWVLADVGKWSSSRMSAHGNGAPEGLVSALKSVSLVEVEVTVEGDALAVKATGLSADEETRGLLEDALRGLTAAWRIAAQEKSPDLVSAIRKLKISHDDEGVTISGKLPGDLIRSLSAAHSRTGK